MKDWKNFCLFLVAYAAILYFIYEGLTYRPLTKTAELQERARYFDQKVFVIIAVEGGYACLVDVTPVVDRNEKTISKKHECVVFKVGQLESVVDPVSGRMYRFWFSMKKPTQEITTVMDCLEVEPLASSLTIPRDTAVAREFHHLISTKEGHAWERWNFWLHEF